MVGSEFGILRDDTGMIVVNEAAADMFAEKMAHRFHAAIQKSKGGRPDGLPGVNPAAANQWGGKGIIKFNPSDAERQNGIQQEISLLVWQSPDGLPHYVTIEVGRLVSGVGGPGSDGTPGGLQYVNPITAVGLGSVGGGTWPAAQEGGIPLYYRAAAQVVMGTPGAMQDQFWIDINRGQRFTACVSYVAVTAQMRPPPVDELSGVVISPAAFQTSPGVGPQYVSGSMVVYATLGMAVAPSLAPVEYTQFIDYNSIGEGPLQSASRIVPPRANFLLPLLAQQPDTVSIFFFDNVGDTQAQTSIINNQVSNLIAIPEDTYGVAVRGTQSQNYRLIYQLSV
jgi:hypothetical protein